MKIILKRKPLNQAELIALGVATGKIKEIHTFGENRIEIVLADGQTLNATEQQIITNFLKGDRWKIEAQ